MNGPSRYARTEVVAQAAALQTAARRLDQALTSGAPVNQQRYEARAEWSARSVKQ